MAARHFARKDYDLERDSSSDSSDESVERVESEDHVAVDVIEPVSGAASELVAEPVTEHPPEAKDAPKDESKPSAIRESSLESGNEPVSVRDATKSAQKLSEPEKSDTAESHSDESESESESDSDAPIARPVFKRKTRQQPPSEVAQTSRKDDTVEKFRRAATTGSIEKVSRVDDRDDLDPEGEYLEWVAREKARMKRDHDRLAELEATYEEKMERREKRLKTQ